MRQVVVKFVGQVDAAVRKKAKSLGHATPANQKKALIFQGYILTSAASSARAIVTAIQMPALYVSMAAGYQDAVTYLPKTVLVTPKMLKLPRKSLRRSRNKEAYFNELSLALPDRLDYLSLGASSNHDGQYRDMFFSGGVDHNNSERYIYKAVVQDQAFVRDIPSMNSLLLTDNFYPWYMANQAIIDAITIDISRYGRERKEENFSVRVESGYLTKLYGSRVRFAGAPQRTDDLRDRGAAEKTQRDTYGPGGFWFKGVPVPAPVFWSGRSGDVRAGAFAAGTENPWAFKSTLQAPGARPQPCFPHAAASGESSLIMFPCVNIPDGFDVLNIQAKGDGFETGNVSALSIETGALDYTLPELANIKIGYGTPLACVLALNHRIPLSGAEADQLLAAADDLRYKSWCMAPPSPYSGGARLIHPTTHKLLRKTDYPSINSPIGTPIRQSKTLTINQDLQKLVEGELSPDIGAHAFVSPYDFSEWVWPEKMADAWERMNAACEVADDDPEKTRCLSNTRRGCVFGDVRSTQIGNELELMFAVSSDASSVMPVIQVIFVRDRNGNIVLDENGQPVTFGPKNALVLQTKTALAVVKAVITSDANGITAVTPYSHELLYRDVIGPPRSALVEAAMDAATAKKPTLLWSSVINGKRVYIARAVRFVRDEDTGSAKQLITVRLGRQKRHSLFEESARYGPRADLSAFEEIWLIIDRARTIIPVPHAGLLRRQPDLQVHVRRTLFGGIPDNLSELGNNHMGLSGSQEHDVVTGLATEEQMGATNTQNTVAQISTTDVLVVAHPPYAENQESPAVADQRVSLTRINCNTGEHSVVFSGVLEGAEARGSFLTLDCYQREIVKEDEVIFQACLFLYVDSSVSFGEGRAVHASTDGGASWVRVSGGAGDELFGSSLANYVEDETMRRGTSDPFSPLYKGASDE